MVAGIRVLVVLALVQVFGQAQELLKTWQPLKSLEGPQQVQKMAVATDGTLLLVLTRDNRVRVFDPRRRRRSASSRGFRSRCWPPPSWTACSTTATSSPSRARATA